MVIAEDNIPYIEYNSSKNNSKKRISFIDILFADKKHDTRKKYAFSIYTINDTITFMTQDETIMNEWLCKIREYHSELYPEFKRYDAIFKACLVGPGLAKDMNILGEYRVAIHKDSLDFIPLLTEKQQQSQVYHPDNYSNNHHQMQRFHKRHPLLTSKTIEVAIKRIRRCGHTAHSTRFFIESGRQSQIGEGELWMKLEKKYAAQHLHELLLATMKLSSTESEAPRSRSNSSNDHIFKNQNTITYKSQPISYVEEDSGYLPMA